MSSPTHSFQPIAGVLAFLVPGLGHWYLGETRRAVAICVGVFGLFFGGLMVGGIDAVDSGQFFANKAREVAARFTGGKPERVRAEGGDPIWFAGQMFVGPTAFVVDHIHHTSFKVLDPATGMWRSANPTEGRDLATGRPVPGQAPPSRRSIGRPNEIGTLMATIAGMMNLICIIDAVHNTRRRRRDVAGGGA